MERSTGSIDHWDRYWQRKNDLDKVYSNEGRILRNLNGITDLEGRVVIEVGAGTGRDSRDLAMMGAVVVVLDRSKNAIDIIRSMIDEEGAQLLPVIGDVQELPFHSESVHLVFHQGLLEHFEDPCSVLEENHRVLEENGYLLVDVPQKYHPYTLVKHILMAMGKWFAGWETEYTIHGLERTVKQAGFRDVIRSYGSWMKPSFFYRSFREVLLGLGFELPMYPSICPSLRNFRDRIGRAIRRSNLAFHTYHTIGIIVRK